MNEREYKRIPAAVSWFSEAYCQSNEPFFAGLVEEMLQNGKEKRVEDLLNTMEQCGGVRQEYARQIVQKLLEAQ